MPTPPEASLDLFDLVRAGNFDARSAALCWGVAAQHGSIIVAGAPQRAGKTTTLDAIVATLPKAVRRVQLQGMSEQFAWLDEGVKPDSTLLYAAEISDHMPMYSWGAPAKKALGLLTQGFALGATVHADSAEETIGVLVDDLGAPARDVARIDLLVIIRVYRSGADVIRRVVELGRPRESRGKVTAELLATFDEAKDEQRHNPKLEADLVGDIDARTRFFEQTMANGRTRADGALASYATGGRPA